MSVVKFSPSRVLRQSRHHHRPSTGGTGHRMSPHRHPRQRRVWPARRRDDSDHGCRGRPGGQAGWRFGWTGSKGGSYTGTK
uniref:Uncharacterized protein n=1 Tax=Macrostomum lignano TaxID=282301 RepID=A0A1I8GFP0_9PLAT